MRSPESPPPDSKESSQHTFSFRVEIGSCGDLAELQPIHVDSYLNPGISEPEMGLPIRIKESPDDLFASFFGAGCRQARGSILTTPDVVDGTLIRLVSEGLKASDYHHKLDFTVRCGGYGTTADGIPVRWISFHDPLTESWLLPDFSVVHSASVSDSLQQFASARGVERFSFAEPRILIVGEGLEQYLRIFIPADCRDEAIEHFIRAAAGANEPSFLYNYLEYEMVRILDGETDIGSENFHDVLLNIRNNLSWSPVGLEGLFSHAWRADNIILDLSVADPTNTPFFEAFGTPSLRCKISFGDPESALVKPPSFEWLHR
jgi:hypothetical protein